MTKLENALVAIQSNREAAAFLKAMLTPHEAAAFQNRWQALELRLAGVTQRDICRKLGISIATASRSARVLRTQSQIVQTLLDRVARPQ